MLNERHWINAECFQREKECSDAWENKSSGRKGEGHLLILKNQLFWWQQIKSPICIWEGAYTRTHTCVLNTSIYFMYFCCHSYLIYKAERVTLSCHRWPVNYSNSLFLLFKEEGLRTWLCLNISQEPPLYVSIWLFFILIFYISTKSVLNWQLRWTKQEAIDFIFKVFLFYRLRECRKYFCLKEHFWKYLLRGILLSNSKTDLKIYLCSEKSISLSSVPWCL